MESVFVYIYYSGLGLWLPVQIPRETVDGKSEWVTLREHPAAGGKLLGSSGRRLWLYWAAPSVNVRLEKSQSWADFLWKIDLLFEVIMLLFSSPNSVMFTYS